MGLSIRHDPVPMSSFHQDPRLAQDQHTHARLPARTEVRRHIACLGKQHWKVFLDFLKDDSFAKVEIFYILYTLKCKQGIRGPTFLTQLMSLPNVHFLRR